MNRRMNRRVLGLLAGALSFAPAIVLASPEAHDAHGGAPPSFADIEWITPVLMHKGNTGLVWVLVNFAVLMWLLDRLLFRGLRKRTAERHDTIKSELERATRARREAEGILSEYRQRMDRLEGEAIELMEDAKRRAEADRRSIIAAAEQEAERIEASARAAAEREADVRRRRIENEVVDRAIERAEALLREKLAPPDQTRMVAEYITRIGSLDFDRSDGAPGGTR
jgi:ATP synthase F0 subunit b